MPTTRFPLFEALGGKGLIGVPIGESGRKVGDLSGGTLIQRTASARGILIDGNKFRCPPNTPGAGDFTDPLGLSCQFDAGTGKGKKSADDDVKRKAPADGNPCWPGYEMIGMKPGKRGKPVPRCVPISSAGEKRAAPSAGDLDVITDAVGLDPLPQERVTGDVMRGYGPRRGNLERLLRYWRPIMRKPGGFRRCLVILADHPELYPLENICAWLHHETTGLWPNEGCHHPGMKNCRRKARGVVRGSLINDAQFEARMRKLKPNKKDAWDARSVQNEINFKALAYMTASGARVREKAGLWSSNSRTARAVESALSYVVPGDFSRIRHPVRSTAYRALTPGGGLNRIGGERGFRCPPGFANGGKFTDRRFSTCGPKLFEQAGASDDVLKATRRAAGAAVAAATTGKPSGRLGGAIGAKEPKKGTDVTPGAYKIPDDILRAAVVEPIGKASPRKVDESLVVNSPLVYEDRKAPGKLVRRDGSVMDLTTSIEKLASLKDVDDMKDGFLISRVDDPNKMGDVEMPVLNSNLKGFVLALPGGNHIRVSKMPKATPAAMKGANRRFNTLKDAKETFAYASALTEAIEDSKGALSLDFHMPDMKNPRQVIQIQRDGAIRSVMRWVYQLFLAETAPARNKATKPWTLITEQDG